MHTYADYKECVLHSMNVIWMYYIDHVTYQVNYQCRLCHITAIHQPSPVASWGSKVSIVCTLQK